MADGNTLYECVTEFLMYLKGVLVLSENTLTSYKCDLEQFMNMPGINRHASIKTVTVENLRQCIGELSRKKRAASSINRFISAFRSLFAYCRKLGYIDVNPAASIKSVKMPKRLPRFMTQAEVDELCNQPAVKELLWEKRDKALFEMMYSSGCRVSEIANLHLSDISADFSQAVVTGKGKKDRIVYFADDARKAMREYIDDRRCRFGPLHLQTEKSFFVNQHGAALSVRGIRYILSRYSGGDGTNHHVSPHAFRHTFATAMITNGADVRLVQELLGHSSISTTQRYTHISTEKMIELYNKAHPHGGNKDE
ncbi:MAG: tyrosine-type recombinase/integrase [Treponema sp.]|nr:tyrosine-type recombinase/integrase [Treponema sp.]